MESAKLAESYTSLVGDESLAESLVEEEMKRLMASAGAEEDVGLLPSPGTDTGAGPAGRGGRKSMRGADKAALASQAMAALEAAEGAAGPNRLFCCQLVAYTTYEAPRRSTW